jgi:hypothetical protein
MASRSARSTACRRGRDAVEHACRRPPEKIGLTEREHEICAVIGPVLREKGLLFTGIDVIDGWLTEINVTSPTGIQELERFDGTNAAALIWDAIERKLAARRLKVGRPEGARAGAASPPRPKGRR